MEDDIKREKKLLKSKIALDKMLSKSQEDKISLEKLRKVKTQIISHSISLFEIKFSFNYFFSLLMSFKFNSAALSLEIIVSSLLFSFYDKMNFEKKKKEKIKVIKGKKNFIIL